MKLFYCWTLILCSTINLFALDKRDSLYLVYQNSTTSKELANSAYELSSYYKTQSLPDSALFYINQSIAHAKQTQDQAIIGKYYLNGGDICNALHIRDIADSLYNEALLYKLSNDDRYQALSNLAWTTEWLKNFEQSQKYINKLESEKHKMSSKALAYYYHKRGQIHWNKQENFTALEYLIKSNDLTKDSWIYSKNNYFINGIYYRYRSYDDVLKMCFLEIERAKTLQNKNGKLQPYFYIIDAYYQKKEFDNAIYHGKQALALQNEYDDLNYLGYIYFLVGKTHLAKSEFDAAYNSFQKGIERSKLRNEMKELYDNYLGLALYYYAKEDWTASLSYLNKVKKSRYYFEQEDISHDVNKTFLSIYEHQNLLDSAYFHLKELYQENNGEQQKALEDYINASNIIREYNDNEKTMIADLTEEQASKKVYSMLAIMTMFVSLVLGFLFFRIRSYNQELNTVNEKVEQKNKLLIEANNTIKLKNETLNKLVHDLGIANNKKEEVIKYLENFAYIVAHDMKAPVRVASSFSNLLLKKNEDYLDDQSRECLNFISNNMDKMSLMIDDVLSLAKLDQDLPDFTDVDLTEIIHQINYVLKHKHDTSFKVEILDKLPLVWGHQTLFYKLFLNLINNSIVHNNTEFPTIVQISTQNNLNNKKYITIILQDNSGGIPNYLVGKVFDLFESSNKDLGNGIGLTICKKIVDYYGGKIWIKTEEDIGTEFYFELLKSQN